MADGRGRYIAFERSFTEISMASDGNEGRELRKLGTGHRIPQIILSLSLIDIPLCS
ncbi:MULTISPECIES: hypothetical protein [unclassified Mesorhizobium]|uniref:hypothetical protein n=1 Tax=unclassified Mesorhizobium TaxID=325217 RepID=UPI001FE1C111|nr:MULTISPECIES: hypothetical protein [unclassified Mesorhizobium]